MDTPLIRFVVLGAFCACAWTTSGADSIHAVSVSTQDQPDGHLVVAVHNDSQVPITAIVAEGKRSLIGGRRSFGLAKFFDSILDPYDERPVQSGGSHEFVFFGPSPSRDKLEVNEARVVAVLFQDGGTWGAPEWIQTLKARRAIAFKFENAALQAFVEHKMRTSPSDDVLQRIDSLKQSALQGASQYEKIVVEADVREIRTLLESANRSVPQSSPANFQITPLNASVADDVVINRLRERLQAFDGDKGAGQGSVQ